MENSSLKPFRWVSIVALLLGGIIFPIICLVAAFSIGFKPDWQSGRFEDYTLLVLNSKVIYLFFPVLAYSMLCLGLTIIPYTSPLRRFFLVRLGIYTGVVLSLQFLFIVLHSYWGAYQIPAIGLSLIISIILIFIGPYVLRKMVALLGKRVTGLIISGIIAIGITVYIVNVKNLSGALIILPCTPFWTPIAYLWVSIRLFREPPVATGTRWVRVLWGISWLVSYIITWRLAVAKVLEVYASLPKKPPDCYISTATVRGHKQIVQSYHVRTPAGNILVVNSQMQYFKCAELVMMRVTPLFHGICRKIYDSSGPHLAKYIKYPLMGDITYFLLKPLEYIIMIHLKLLIPNMDHLSRRIYGERIQ